MKREWATDRKTQDESQWIVSHRILSALTIPDSNKSSPKDLSPPLSEMVICFYAFNGVRRQSAPEPKLIDWRITLRMVDNAASQHGFRLRGVQS